MRDYDKEYRDTELRRYAYNFDSVLRRYMLKTFEPLLINAGPTLELGCFEGEFTQILAERFKDLTVIEASGELVEKARSRTGCEQVNFIHSMCS